MLFNWVSWLSLVVLALGVVYIGCALVLIFLDDVRPVARSRAQLLHLPPAESSFSARDGGEISYRYFDSTSDTRLVLLSQADDDDNSAEVLARVLSTHNVARVYIPRLKSPAPAQDPANQLPGELHDLITRIDNPAHDVPLLVATHSPNSELIYHFTGGYYGHAREMPELSYFRARDGALLAFRYYPSENDTVLIILHGASAQSGAYSALAHFVSGRGLAQVYTPNIRGHYRSGARPGDVDYIGQLEDDLADLISAIRSDNPRAKIILAGHSAGGGLAIRFAGGRYGSEAAGYILLAPYLGHTAPIIPRVRKSSWAQPNRSRGIGITLLNWIGIRRLNHLPVIEFDLPAAIRNGSETLRYSYRLWMAISPRVNYRRDLRALDRPLLALLGEADATLDPENSARILSNATRGTVRVVPGATHLGIIFNMQTHQLIKEWLEHFSG